MHTPRMCCFCEVDAEAAAHWQDPDTVARVLKGWCDARCAGSFLHTSIRAALPNRFTSIVPQTLGIAAQQRCAPHH